MTGPKGDAPSFPVAGEPGAATFVWGTWGLLLAGAAGLVLAYGSALPRWDDVGILDVLCGVQRLDADWLMGRHNEHRLPLPRLALLGALRLSGGDFRSGMAITVAALGAATALLIARVGRARPGLRYADGFLPLVLLNPGQYANLLWGWQVVFGLTAALTIALLAILYGATDRPKVGPAIASGLALVLLPLCGASGLALAAPLAVGQLAAAFGGMRSSPARSGVLALGGLSSLGLIAGLLRDGTGSSAGEVERAGPSAVLRTALQFLSVGLGPPIGGAWPWVGGVVLLTLVGAAAVLTAAWVRRPSERPAVGGLAAFLLGMLALALAVGWGRASAGAMAGFEARYVTISAPFWAAIALVFSRWAPPATAGLVPMALLTAGGILLWPNATQAIDHGRSNRVQADAVVRDLRVGAPPSAILRRHTPYLHPSQRMLGEFLPMLKAARVGPFRDMGPEPSVRERPLDPKDAALALAEWDNDAIVLTGVEPSLSWQLEPPVRVRGIRLRYDHENDAGLPARFELRWRRPGQADLPASQRIVEWNLPTGRGHDLTLWIDDDVAGLQIRPDNRPGRFRIESLTLLLPR